VITLSMKFNSHKLCHFYTCDAAVILLAYTNVTKMHKIHYIYLIIFANKLLNYSIIVLNKILKPTERGLEPRTFRSKVQSSTRLLLSYHVSVYYIKKLRLLLLELSIRLSITSRQNNIVYTALNVLIGVSCL